jgi:hypothetical protein
LELNKTGYAEQALEQYWQKLNLTEVSLTRFGQDATGLLHAQEMITRHQTVLANLLFLYPNSTGLARGYNNSLVLERKFGEKTQMRFDRYTEKNNKTILKAVRLETRKQNHAGEDNTIAVETVTPGRNETGERIRDKKNDIPFNITVTIPHHGGDDSSSGTTAPRDDKGSSKDQGKKGRD